MAFSGHKLMGPMGIGVLYGKKELLEEMPPFLTGGEMIDSVSRTGAVFAPLPHKFEAGTVNAAGAWGLKAAIEYLQQIGFDEIKRREEALTSRALEGLKEIPHVHVLGSEKAEEHCGILTFTIDGVHPHDVSAILDADGIAVRAGHHCAQPLMEYLGVSTTTNYHKSQPFLLQYRRRDRCFCRKHEDGKKENGLWRVEIFTMKY